jgi:hypothetical protein
VERLREEHIAKQDAGGIAPTGIDGDDMASESRSVEDVIVHQRCGVDHFNDGGQHVVRGCHSATSSTGKEEKRGPQSLASVVLEVGDQPGNVRPGTV